MRDDDTFSFIILPYFATISKVKSRFLTLNLYCVPFVWIPRIWNKFCEKIEGLVCFSVLIGSHGPETHVQLKIRFSKFVQKFRKFSDFDTEKVPKMGSNQNMSEFSP